MIRMILTDLDHTLLKQDGSISQKTLQILAACRAKGIRFAIATARYWIGAERYIEAHIWSDTPIAKYIAAYKEAL